ncbi:MAG: hypothetical protein N2506_06815, partial [Dehalococcoidales bacterium]|nr:hypothetical protein [Dehalococcoidales bacterium]
DEAAVLKEWLQAKAEEDKHKKKLGELEAELDAKAYAKYPTLTEAEVRAYFEPKLPKYTWPRIILFGDIPRNPTGKIEKPKLRERYANVRWTQQG